MLRTKRLPMIIGLLGCVICWSATQMVAQGYYPRKLADGSWVNCTGDPIPAPNSSAPQDLFAAINSGVVDARVVMRDQFNGRVVLKNVSALPLALNMPAFVAARPMAADRNILAQQGFQFPGMQGSQNSGSRQGATQTVGASTSSGSGQNNLFNLGGPPFNIAPEQVRFIDLHCLCLEQGKPNPRTGVKYELVPLDEANADPRLPELLAAAARGEVDRDTAQAAAWHVANNLSWEQLAELSQRVALNASRPVFNLHQLSRAKKLLDQATARVSEKQNAAKLDPAKRGEPTKTVAADAREFMTTTKSAVKPNSTQLDAAATKSTARRTKDRL